MGALLAVCLVLLAGGLLLLYRRQKAEKRLWLAQRDHQQTLLVASTGMTRVRDLSKLLGLLVHFLTKSVGASSARVFLLDRPNQSYVLRASRDQQQLQPGFRLTNEQTLTRRLHVKRVPVILEDLKRELHASMGEEGRTLRELVSELEHQQIALVVPSFIEQELFGFLTLGYRFSRQPYTQDDLSLFTTIANQAALAIDSCLFLEQLQTTQAQLFEASKLVALGQMSAGMSHQLNNRFMALAAAAGGLRELLPELVEDPQLSEGQRQRLLQFEAQIKSIEEEAVRGGDITKQFTRYVKATGGDQLLKPADIITGALGLLEYKRDLKTATLTNSVPEELPFIQGNAAHLKDVFFNLLDNAYDAITAKQERMAIGKLPQGTGYRGEVKITTVPEREQGWLQLCVEDNGVGMTKEELDQLFVPFFTTKGSAEKGNGLGLFVIKKIVEAHRGTIGMQSQYGKGTTFSVRLPTAQERH